VKHLPTGFKYAAKVFTKIEVFAKKDGIVKK